MTPGSVVAVAVVVLAMTFNFAIHKIEEGHVGVYFRGGALLSAITFPGKRKGEKDGDSFESSDGSQIFSRLYDFIRASSHTMIPIYDPIR